eukprot:3897837-Ditylum_brightwellii.AAC.1
MIVQRELERLTFQSADYWGLTALLCIKEENDNKDGEGGKEEGGGGEQKTLEAALYSVNGARIANGGDFDGKTGQLKSSLLLPSTSSQQQQQHKEKESNEKTIFEHQKSNQYSVLHLTQNYANNLLKKFANNEVTPHLRSYLHSTNTLWTITSLTSTARSYSSSPPYITSTLQQDANNKLGLSVLETMRCAQSLYENGYISYMRTDSCNLSEDAIQAGRQDVESLFGM